MQFQKDGCDLENNSYLISHAQKLPLEEFVWHWFWPKLLICLFISLFGFSMDANKGLKLCLPSMALDWELDHHTS